MLAPAAKFHSENSMSCLKSLQTRVLIAMVIAAASYSMYAFSADEQGVVAVTVRYDDLNLSAPAGVETLKRRVSWAAARVCADSHDSDTAGRNRRQRCIRGAIEKALAQVDWLERQE